MIIITCEGVKEGKNDLKYINKGRQDEGKKERMVRRREERKEG